MSQELAEIPEKKKKVIVVGGGTAGWLAAYVICDNLKRREEPAEVVMVESSAIPTIGVGEGTTALFRAFLQHFTLPEDEFLRETRATVKLGIRHRAWRGDEPYYDGPIDDPHWQKDVPGGEGAEMLNIHAIAEGKRVAQSHHFTHLMRENKVPFMRDENGQLVRSSPFHNAYHFDNAKVAAWLRGNLPDLEVVDAVVKDCVLAADGKSIEAIVLEDGSKMEADIFVDCTGFRRLLINALGARWIDYVKVLPLNRAFPFQLPHDEGKPVIPYTHAWAQDNGWMWQIPTQDRVGNGYAYSDAFTTPEKAHEEIEKKLGRKVEPLADIRFASGRLENVWLGNCLAVGLSAGFLEPLEATSIHSTLIQLLLLDRDHLEQLFDEENNGRDAYNHKIGQQFDDFRTFLVVHYRGGRKDTPFWRHVKDECKEEVAMARLEDWQEHMPSGEDFVKFLGALPHVEAQLYYPVLNGLNLLDRKLAKKELARSGLERELAYTWRLKVDQAKKTTKVSLGHAAFLRAIEKGEPIVAPVNPYMP